MTKIKDFKPQERYAIPLLIKDVKNGTTNKGAAYLTITVADNTGMIDGKFWDVKPEDTAVIHVGHVEEISFEVLDYKNSLQLRINHVQDLDQSAVDLESFVAASTRPLADRQAEVKKFVYSIHNENLRKLVVGVLRMTADKYFTYPAASKIHHNFLGGLSEHSLSIAEMCEEVCKHYHQLNRDLLIAGALIHDVGKTIEMSGPITTEYTLQGRLEGHISIANGILSEVADSLGLEGSEEAALLHHMILSHHGHYEYGSPVLPMVQEAEVLSLMDNLDARMNTLKQALDSTAAGNWTGKLFALDNRQFYKPTLKKE